MPLDLKESIEAEQLRYFTKLKGLKKFEDRIMYAQVQQLMSALESLHVLAKSTDKWDQVQDVFRNEVRKIDVRRGEDFKKVFPELAGLLIK
jgi:hypothetical protein